MPACDKPSKVTNPEPWEDPKSRSTFGINLHHRSGRVQNWGLHFLDAPSSLRAEVSLQVRLELFQIHNRVLGKRFVLRRQGAQKDTWRLRGLSNYL